MVQKKSNQTNFKVQLINYTQNPEQIVTQSALLCYSSKNILEIQASIDEIKKKKMIRKILALGHLSVLEHISFTFAIENISRVTSHQLVRHRIASFSQRSQRYVKNDQDYKVVIPICILHNKELEEKYTRITNECHQFYLELLDRGIAAEDARYVLPQATQTSLIFTANARELIHFFRLRCCNRAQWEIRELAISMLQLVRDVAPNIFEKAGPGCVLGPCPEGEMTCGHPWKKSIN